MDIKALHSIFNAPMHLLFDTYGMPPKIDNLISFTTSDACKEDDERPHSDDGENTLT